MNSVSRLIVVSLLLLATSASYAETLYFGAPPREGSEAKSRAFYEPIAKAVSKVLNVPVEFKFKESFFKYGTEMRHDGYDIIFDGPHFGTWRINQLGHRALVRLPGQLRFVVITKRNNLRVTDKNSLIAKKVCGPAIPNLATLSALSSYKSMIRTPMFQSIKGGIKGSYNAMKKGKCDASVMRDAFFLKKIKDAERQDLRIVFDTKPLPNQTITTSSRITAEQNDKLLEFFTSEAGSKAADKLLSRFSKKKKIFIKANPDLYQGLDKVLIKYAFGWKPKK